MFHNQVRNRKRFGNLFGGQLRYGRQLSPFAQSPSKIASGPFQETL
jgi:hypothetical protein